MAEFAERSLAFLSRKREDRIAELERRLARYDEAIRLLNEWQSVDLSDNKALTDLSLRTQMFRLEEPKP